MIRVVARHDDDIRTEVEDLLERQGLMKADALTVEEGAVTVESAADRGWRRLIEILMRTVPGGARGALRRGGGVCHAQRECPPSPPLR